MIGVTTSGYPKYLLSQLQKQIKEIRVSKNVGSKKAMPLMTGVWHENVRKLISFQCLYVKPLESLNECAKFDLSIPALSNYVGVYLCIYPSIT